MDSHELAWAAGFFDGEGWVNRSGRGVQARINQAGPTKVPVVLSKFQRIVGVGRIHGPIIQMGRQPLYYWEATSRKDVTCVANLVGPWLGFVKRADFERALGCGLADRVWPGSSSEELAWAGGFFDGEGSTYLVKHRTHPGYLVPELCVTQSGGDGVPEVLTRFRAALEAVGNVNGPYRVKWALTPVYRWRTSSLKLVPLVLHRLMPFIGETKRAQAHAVLKVINTQEDLPRGNPAFGAAGSRYCLRGHDKWNARLRSFRGRGKREFDNARHLRQCFVCVRERARAKRRNKSAARSPTMIL